MSLSRLCDLWISRRFFSPFAPQMIDGWKWGGKIHAAGRWHEKKGLTSHHITSQQMDPPGDPRSWIQEGRQTDADWSGRKNNSDALENTEEPSVVERFHAGKVEFILGFHGEERRTLQPPGAVLTLKITATNQSGSCTSRKTTFRAPLYQGSPLDESAESRASAGQTEVCRWRQVEETRTSGWWKQCKGI